MPKKIERVAGLDSRLSDIAAACDLVLTGLGLQSIRLSCHEGPNMRFIGGPVYNWCGKPNRDGRWLELSLYAVEGGQWVAASSWCSKNPDEQDITRARIVETVRDVMAAWGWANSAKIAAKELQWDVAEYVGGVGP
jgi:hypothetical protein